MVYGSCKGQYSVMNTETGQSKNYWIGGQSLYGNAGGELMFRFQRVSPMATSPHDPNVLYYGSQFLHRTRDMGVTAAQSKKYTDVDPTQTDKFRVGQIVHEGDWNPDPIGLQNLLDTVGQATALKRVGPNTRVIRVPAGGCVLPGFIESHAHLRSLGRGNNSPTQIDETKPPCSPSHSNRVKRSIGSPLCGLISFETTVAKWSPRSLPRISRVSTRREAGCSV